MTRPFTLLVERVATELDVRVEDGAALWVATEALLPALGWELKEQGLCQGSACIPRSVLGGALREGADGIEAELGGIAAAIGRPLACDLDAGCAALGMATARRAATFESFQAPDVTLATVSGERYRLGQTRGHKTLLVAYGSWCGCREDLGAWQELYAELAPHGFQLVTIALDRRVEDARPFIERAQPQHPSLIDTEHAFADAYSILNVPTCIWVDEAGQVVRPNEAAFATDLFVAFHERPSGPYLDAVRAWVTQDELPLERDERRARQRPLSADEQLAKAEGALAFHLLEQGNAEAAERHFERAAELSPFDWTIRRGSMPLRDKDPFGVDFAPLWEEFERAGKPYYDGD